MDDVIGQLLRAGLLRSLGDDGDRTKRLRAASAHLRDQYLTSARSHVPSALIAAVDEDTRADLPLLNTARAAIVDQWEMFENAYAQRDPATILRAVVFDAIIAAARSDRQISAAVWYTLRSAAGTVSAGRWSAQVESITAALEAEAASDIDQLWIPRVKTSSIKMPSVLAREGSNETERLRNILKELGEKLREALGGQDQALAAMARRDRLLWWRLGGRSTLLGTNYADAPDPASGVVAAAVDLHRQVPSPAPHSVEDLLVDVLREANLADHRVDIDAMVAAATRMQLITNVDANRPFLLADVIVGGCQPEGLPRAHTNMTSAAKTAVLFFQGLQVRRLLGGEDAQGENS